MRERCPYCDTPQEICHDDGYGYGEDVAHQQMCGTCNRTFVYFTSIHFTYDLREAPCLNGEPHKYEPTFTTPVEYTRMQCAYCEHERQCTDAEMAEVKRQREARAVIAKE